MGDPGYGVYQLAAAAVHEPVPEFLQRAEELAQRHQAHRANEHDKSIDDEIARLAGESREKLWHDVKAVLDQAIGLELARPVPAGARPLQGKDYLMEKLDTGQHRAGFLLRDALDVYLKMKPPQPFFEWLDGLPELERVNLLRREPLDAATMMKKYGVHAADSLDTLRRMAQARQLTLMPSEVRMFVKGVAYLDEIARSRYRLKIQGGRFWSDADECFHTAGMHTVHSGPGWAIFVQSPGTGSFYSASHIKGIFHHSSFLSGEPVLGAGEWQVEHGQLKTITGKSGHYQPQAAHFLAVLQSLQTQALDLSEAKAILFDQNKAKHAVPVADILRGHKLPQGLLIM